MMLDLSNADEIQSVRWVSDVVPRIGAPGWGEIDPPYAGMRCFRNWKQGLEALVSAAPMDDGRRWLHFSLVHRHSVPTWSDLVAAKEALLGPETKAILVIAPRSQWVNIHPNCLHLFVCLDGDPLPDFTQGSGSL